MALSAAWSDKILFDVWDRLEGAVKPEWLPTQAAKGKSFEELGCGHFGCVMPTGDPDVVLKLTSDTSEAQFAQLALQHAWVPGICTYYKVVQVPEAQRRRRPVYLLWRQAAEDVGYLQKQVWGNDYDARTRRQGADYLSKLKEFGMEVQKRMTPALKRRPTTEQRVEYFKETWQAYQRAGDNRVAAAQDGRNYRPWDTKGVVGVGVFTDLAYDLMGEMMNNPVTYAIGEGAQFWLEEQQILLADLHLGNIGKDEDGTPMVIDPGLAFQVGPDNYPPPAIESL